LCVCCGIEGKMGEVGKVFEGCIEGEFVSNTNSCRIQTYRWNPPESVGVKGMIFLVHGIHAWVGFEFLECNSTSDTRTEYSGSIVETYNQMGFIVYAHDHIGHGKSEGLRGFFTLNDLVSDTNQFLEQEKSKNKDLPTFIQGTSMGGMICVFVSAQNPSLNLSGVVLISPAVVPPESMFGVYGKFLAMISAFLNTVIPTHQVIKLPMTPFEDNARQWTNDPLCYQDKLRVRSGREMYVAYTHIEAIIPKCSFPTIIFSGTTDTLVNPQGIQSFYDRIPSKEKTLKVMDGLWHDLLHEPGAEQVKTLMFEWVSSRLQ